MTLAIRISIRLFLEEEDAQSQQDRHGDQQGAEIADEVGEAEALGEGSPRDGDEIGRRVDLADDGTHALQRRDRVDQAGILHGRYQGDERRGEDRRDLTVDEGRDDEPHSGGDEGIDKGGGREGGQAAGERHAEDEDGEGRQHQEIQEGQRDIGDLLAEQEFEPRDGRHVEIDDRAQLFFPHDTEHGQHGRDHEQEERDDARNHGHEALHVRIIAIAQFDLEIAARGGFAVNLAGLLGQPCLVHALHIAADGFGAHGHGAVDPGGNLRLPAMHDIAPEAGRDLDGEAQFAVTHAPVEIVVILDRRPFGEIAGARDLLDIVTAHRRVVAVQNGEGQVLDIHVDAVADDEHQDDAAEDGERCADRIAAQFQRLALGIGEHAAKIEGPPRRRRLRALRRLRRLVVCSGLCR